MKTLKCSRLSTTYQNCPPSYTRILHAAPDMPPVDVYVNGNPVAMNLAYKQTAGYFTVSPCTYHIKIFPSGKKYGECPIAEACFEICAKTATTFAFLGDCRCGTGLLGIQEIFDPCRRLRERCKAYVRFINLSPNSPPLDVAIVGGTRLFRNVPYTTHTKYTPVDPGTYVFQLRPAGSRQQGVASAPVTLERGTTSTVYALGNVGGTPPLETIATVDGNY
ncbi:protein of unknown function [Sporobacter termitidis DSM 10068]|uniref:DUF4397 domain-containing protein n=1 Tax=Sporobacter termitidis DSM 10068 TaxID=1123282 RepID=A0A1M5WZP1_9FIRM|nr:DUF4397 domain-containing protein [Sporobacter termitidis]SHH93067.1 protein of unknown function [Sporobacter termitidis DSM 10068]